MFSAIVQNVFQYYFLPEAADEPEHEEGGVVPADGGHRSEHRVDEHGHDQRGAPPVDVAETAPQEPAQQHPHEPHDGDRALSDICQLQVALECKYFHFI